MQTCVPPPAPIRVVGVGDTHEQARDTAYRQAIETYMGAVVVSDREMRGVQLVKDTILVYSAAYVDRMRVISETKEGNRHRVELDIWISPSKIANRILTVYPKEQNIDSARIAEQFRTYSKSKEQGDKLLQNVLEIFPQNAFFVETKQTEFRLDAHRVPYVRVSYSMQWNKNYFIALEETVKVISDGKSARQNPAATMVFGGGSSWFLQPYFFNDVIALQILHKKTQSKKPVIKLTMQNEHAVMFTTCQSIPINFFYGPGHSNMDFAGDKTLHGEFNVRIPNKIEPNVKAILSVDSEDSCAS